MGLFSPAVPPFFLSEGRLWAGSKEPKEPALRWVSVSPTRPPNPVILKRWLQEYPL